MPLRADALDNADFSQAFYVQPAVISQVTALDNPQPPVSGSRPGPSTSPCEALIDIC